MTFEWPNIQLDKTSFSLKENTKGAGLPKMILRSIDFLKDYLENSSSQKICLTFPSKEDISHYLATALTFYSIKDDFLKHASEIYRAHEIYKPGDRLILNDDAIVEWVGSDETGISFKTKRERNASGAICKVKFNHIIKLKPAPKNRHALSAYKRVRKAFRSNQDFELDKLLGINSQGNHVFIKKSVGLVSKLKNHKEFTDTVFLNNSKVSNYIKPGFIDEDGNIETKYTPIVIANSLGGIQLYKGAGNELDFLVIDSISFVTERLTDFRDIDDNSHPILIVTDLSEIHLLQNIVDLGFTPFLIEPDPRADVQDSKVSPFQGFEMRNRNFSKIRIAKFVVNSDEIQSIAKLLQSIKINPNDSPEINSLIFSSIQTFNLISRLIKSINDSDLLLIGSKIDELKTKYDDNKLWLGETKEPLEKAICGMLSIKNSGNKIITKSSQFLEVINRERFTHILTATENEAAEILKFIKQSPHIKPESKHVKCMCTLELDDQLLYEYPKSVLIVGWLKSTTLKRLLDNLYFDKITFLFYLFEDEYFNSFQRNHSNSVRLLNTTDLSGEVREKTSDSLRQLFGDTELSDNDKSIDVEDYELKIEQARYSQYKASSDSQSALSAKRIDFQKDYFMFSSESHRLLVINDLLDKLSDSIRLKKVEAVKNGDIIVFLSTNRDILVETVERIVQPKDLGMVKKWIALWKNILCSLYQSYDQDISILSRRLKENGCVKHQVTIRNWLFDESRIGPSDNIDLVAIGKLGQSDELLNNIKLVRSAISQMKTWRMQASDIILNKIKSELYVLVSQEDLNQNRRIEGLGDITVLKVRAISNHWEDIDIRYVNKLFYK
ncbi:DrmE family protein [Ekhidna sp.]|uniref:DrmE family protein n=1 Tax=Ekhidna sp. TaxID=2608089 RepID=UPI003CCB7A21